jgi:L-alanine-DL-glutamate epimerase-like enolase superfamily enzyme
LLEHIRKHFSAEQIEIRVDANGAFSPERALEKLNILSQFNLHSIEQPIPAGNVEVMSKICQESPIAVALDEELIDLFHHYAKDLLLEIIRPQYIILKPSFIGGYKGTQEWISLAEKYNIGWWITSALESNIGLSAIAQWTFLQNSPLPQGLGTGGLYTNNFESPLEVRDGKLFYNNQKDWDIDLKNTFLK